MMSLTHIFKTTTRGGFLMQENSLNPFADVFNQAMPANIIDVEPERVRTDIETVSVKPSKVDPTIFLAEAIAKAGAARIESIKNSIVGSLAKSIVNFFRAGFEIVGRAIKVAIFKFGIELCAMAIKSLVETMTSKNLSPPSIDTQGVWYNFNNKTQNTVLPNNSQPAYSSGYSSSRPTYDNPFANPFGGSPF
jgi:hypothetical protein